MLDQLLISFASIDSIGIAGFSHEFRTLDGTNPPVEQAFDQSGSARLVSPLMIILAPVIPFLVKFWLRDSPGMRLRRSLEKVADDLLEKSRVGGLGKDSNNSIIGLLREHSLLCFAFVCNPCTQSKRRPRINNYL